MAAANSSGAAVMEKTPLVHLTPNLIMNAQMLAASYENKVSRFCFISSNTVYPLTEFAVKESDANFEYYDKYFIVGWMKRFSEIMCEMYSNNIKAPMQTVTVRPGNLYGPFDKYNYKESKVIAALIRRAIEREDPLSVWGDGLDIKDFLYISDFIEGMLLAFEHAKDFEPINIASGTPVTIREVITVILAATNHSSVSVAYDETKPTMIPKRMIDVHKIKELTSANLQIIKCKSAKSASCQELIKCQELIIQEYVFSFPMKNGVPVDHIHARGVSPLSIPMIRRAPPTCSGGVWGRLR